ncbi:hypothetical protein EN794_032410 [Mesorhizobium sp. M00.F.Ca.ET.151.01.1.1]|nr:hypothetical protein EN794_032410 [Mesorhizobium sp. M00.F.Ca.ET.151.01.1.1]
MRVHHEIPRTVVFVGTEASGRFVPVGSGFLGGVTLNDVHFPFLVTADHVVDLIKADEIAVRLNRKDAEPLVVRIPKAHKFGDHRNDIALFGFTWPGNIEHNAVHLSRAEHEDRQKALMLPGIGDEVATVGLYASHYGYTRNVPVVRIGNIARMPDEEQVRSTRGYCSAYLIETRSIMGLSGSPVFLNVPRIKVEQNGELKTLSGDGVGAYPIGMMVGYHLVRSAEDQIAIPHDEDSQPGPDTDERNTGFAVVIPFEAILDIMETAPVKRSIEKGAEAFHANLKVRPAGATPVLDDEEVAKRRDEALKRALATPPKPKTKPDAV